MIIFFAGVINFGGDELNLTNYSSILAHRNWQIETAVWNLAGFLHFAL